MLVLYISLNHFIFSLLFFCFLTILRSLLLFGAMYEHPLSRKYIDSVLKKSLQTSLYDEKSVCLP
jgi:hypothetical protein